MVISSVARPKTDQFDSPILQVPGEILSSILGLVIDAEYTESYDYDVVEYGRREIAGLTRTCKRFRNILLPELYSRLRISSTESDNEFSKVWEHSTSRLYRTLADNPELRGYCKVLEIYLDRKTRPSQEYGIAESTFNIISWCGNTTHLCISGLNPDLYGGSESRLVSMALESFQRLEILSLEGLEIPLPFLVRVMGDVGRYNTKLSELQLSEEGIVVDAESRNMKELEGTSPVTCLKVHNFKQTPEELDALVTWSSNLEELCIRLERSWYGGSPRSWGGWTFAVVQPILEAQMASLRQLSIVGADNNNDDITRDIENLDLTGFVNLEVLTLPSYFTGLDKRHIPRILAPNLRIFNWLGPFYNSTDRWVIPEEWVMPDDGVSPDEWGIPADWVYSDKRIEDFGQEEEDWVRAMVDFVGKRQRKLKEIYIAFRPQERSRDGDDPSVVYPGGRLERIARDSNEFGIKIRYGEPSIEKLSSYPSVLVP